uniref:Uncharacterized protein n=1 Tax=Triticum urartu TaxID=4572 RepID=A0A8R7U8F6_TRIUA
LVSSLLSLPFVYSRLPELYPPRPSSLSRPPASPSPETASGRTAAIDFVHPEHLIEWSRPVGLPSSSYSPRTSPAVIVDCLVFSPSPTTLTSPSAS